MTAKNIIQNFLLTIPTEEEVKNIEEIVAEIYKKKYKKIIFYALGTSYHTINLLNQFYSFETKNFEIKLCNNDDIDTRKYLIEEINSHSLIVFCSRTGNTHEIIHQLKSIVEQKNFETIKNNLLIITNTITNNKTNIIAHNNNIRTININNGNMVGRFEFFNSIFFFMIEILKPENNLPKIREMLLEKNYFENILNDTEKLINEDLISSLVSPNHAIIIYSNNHILNKTLPWFKHLWYESLGKIKINIYFEDYSSLFHSSIQYYLNHPNDYYYIVKLSSDNSQHTSFNDHFKIYLSNSFLVDIKMSNKIGDLSKGIVEMIGIIVYLADILDIDISDQEYVDKYKGGLLSRLM
jgi:hypothetical protein